MDMKFERHRSDAPLLEAKPSEYLTGGCSSVSAVLDRNDLTERQKQKIVRDNGIRLLTGAS